MTSSHPSRRAFYTLFYLWAGVLVVGLLTGCSATPATGSVEVMALLYSGKANPQGVLSPPETEVLETMLSELPAGAVIERGGLGYEGFMVQWESPGATGIRRIIVYDGIVEVAQTSGTYYLADPHRTLEQWLLDAAGMWLSEGERDLIREDLERG